MTTTIARTPGKFVNSKLKWTTDVLAQVLTLYMEKKELLDQSQLEEFGSLHKQYVATQHRLDEKLSIWDLRSNDLSEHVQRCRQLLNNIQDAWVENAKAAARRNAPVNNQEASRSDSASPPKRPTMTRGQAANGSNRFSKKPSEKLLNRFRELERLDSQHCEELKRKHVTPNTATPSSSAEMMDGRGNQVINGFADCPTLNNGSGTGNSGARKQFIVNGVPQDFDF
ncbi:hypothetical protein BJ138DRAFT_1160075 [Hygrophoropsis aurantiaca]|uniref:Uncharacterized protein n=1 Tax=Hygrophoropsis aurantiaca TaxID=72124 RepID=A0ACB8A1Z3_9AGAM|nr:hypothetical protein BJ138DRAFT_1160075 [Hygrophoropsis aurantiaca]